MTALWLRDDSCARDSRRIISARERPARPKPPMRRKLRRETPSQKRVALPKSVSMGGTPFLQGGRKGEQWFRLVSRPPDQPAKTDTAAELTTVRYGGGKRMSRRLKT